MLSCSEMRWAPVLGLCIAVSWSSSAHAQAGDHIGNENFELAPSLTMTTQQRTNVYLQEGVIGGGEEVVAGTNLRIQPYLSLKAQSADVLFSSSVGYTARKYFQAEIVNLDRYRDFDVKGTLDLLRRSVVGLNIDNRFQINGFESEAAKADDPYIQILSNDLSARLALRPGTSLEVEAGADVSIDNYSGPESNSDFVRTGQNDRLGFGPVVDVKWRFLPKTAVVGRAEWESFTWANNVVEASGSDEAIAIPNGQIIRAETGLRGRFTERMVLNMTAGYGMALYDETSSGAAAGDSSAVDLKGLQGVLLGMNINYSPVDTQNFVLGYRRDFQDVFFTNYVAYNGLNASYTGVFADRYTVDLSGSYRLENYDGEVDRTDHRIVTNGTLSFAATRYLDLSVGGGWRRRASADQLNPDVEFDDMDVRVSMRLSY